jgi:hypothetical protein
MLGKLGLKDDYLVPLPGNVLPAPRRLYFRFLPPVRTSTLAHLSEDEAAVQIRDQTRAAVARGIEALRRIRRSDPRDGFGPMEHWLAGL